MPEPSLAGLLAIATEAVDRASEMLRTRTPGLVTMKSDRDPATAVDYAIERELRDFLHSSAPEVAFQGEEEGITGSDGARFTWALDPVDGTVNFMHGVPLCGISLGLTRAGEPVLGVVDLPFLKERYTASIGSGAYCGENRIYVAETHRLGDAIIAVGDYAVGSRALVKNATRFRVTQLLAQQAQRVRMLGSAATDLVWVAGGRMDASVMLANKPWDTVAGVLIAREAGAVVLDRHGREHTFRSDSTIAVGPALAGQLIALLAKLDGEGHESSARIR